MKQGKIPGKLLKPQPAVQVKMACIHAMFCFQLFINKINIFFPLSVIGKTL